MYPDELARVRGALAATLNDTETGRAVCAVVPDAQREPDGQRLRRFLKGEMGVEIAPERLQPVELEVAGAVLRNMLQGWIFQAATPSDAEALAGTFLACFGPGIRCFSTHRFHVGAGGGHGYTGWPLFGHTYDLGILCASDDLLGIAWICDED
jgi:hypothetical protein